MKSRLCIFSGGQWTVQASGGLTVACGIDSVITIDKMFGPLIFAEVRIKFDFDSCEIVIDRRNIKTGEWSEYSRVPGQSDELDIDFKDDPL